MDIKSRFIAGDLYDLESPEELKKILLTQGIDKSSYNFFKKERSVTELIIENEKIIQIKRHANLYDNNGKFIKDIEKEDVSVKLPITNWKDESLFFLSKSIIGNHKIGGKSPIDYYSPEHENLKFPFIFIGTLDTNDDNFNWINLPSFNISYPINQFNLGIFIDYSDFKKPEILNPETFEDSYSIESKKHLGNLIFQEQKYFVLDQIEYEEYEKNAGNYNLCGIPIWLQTPEIPICPKTGEVMKFVCMINSDKDILIDKRIGFENLEISEYLSFGDDGNLYVFYNPNSKVMHLNVQF